MTLDAGIMLTGALVAILPFLGFTHAMDNALFFILGVVVIGLGIVVRRRDSHPSAPQGQRPSQSKQTFVEAAPSDQTTQE